MEYFTDFLQNKPIQAEHYFALIGAPPELTYNNGLILNSEIILVNFFLVKCKKRRQLPILSNLHSFIAWNRELFLNSSKYRNAWNIWVD